MTTIDELRQRLERAYLEPLTEQSPKVRLQADVTAGATTVQFVSDVLNPDEESYIGPGVVVEVDYELMYVESYNESTKTLTVARGYAGTEAVAHTSAAYLQFPSRWPRVEQEQAIRESIDSLYPPLYTAKQERATIGTMGYVQLPLTAVRILRVQFQSGSRWSDCEGELFSVHPFDDAFAAVQVESGVPENRLALVRYGAKPTVPSAVDADIEDFVPKWERLIIVDAAVRLLAGVDIDAVTQEYLTEQYRLDRFPVRSGSTITESLIRYREYLLDQALNELMANDPLMVQIKDVEYFG